MSAQDGNGVAGSPRLFNSDQTNAFGKLGKAYTPAVDQERLLRRLPVTAARLMQFAVVESNSTTGVKKTVNTCCVDLGDVMRMYRPAPNVLPAPASLQ